MRRSKLVCSPPSLHLRTLWGIVLWTKKPANVRAEKEVAERSMLVETVGRIAREGITITDRKVRIGP